MDTDKDRMRSAPEVNSLNAVTEKIIGCSFKALNTLGSGFLEKVYENALAYELRKEGLTANQQHRVPVYYDGIVVGDFLADLIVHERVIVEIKAVAQHHEIFTAQCLNYLKATGMPICLLLNFGHPLLDIKRYAHPNRPT